MGWTEQEYNSQRWDFIQNLVLAIRKENASNTKFTNYNISSR